MSVKCLYLTDVNIKLIQKSFRIADAVSKCSRCMNTFVRSYVHPQEGHKIEAQQSANVPSFELVLIRKFNFIRIMAVS